MVNSLFDDEMLGGLDLVLDWAILSVGTEVEDCFEVDNENRH